MTVVGADPGLSGAFAVLTDAGDLVEVFDMPVFKIRGKSKLDVDQIGAFLRRVGASRIVIEDVHAMPGQGTASMFNFGFAAGAIHGAAGAVGMRIDMASPRAWKAHFRLGADKEEARQKATRRWPGGHFIRVKDAGRAEAALIGLYGIEMAHPGSAAKATFRSEARP